MTWPGGAFSVIWTSFSTGVNFAFVRALLALSSVMPMTFGIVTSFFRNAKKSPTAMPINSTAAMGMKIHLGNGFGGGATLATGSSTFTTGPSVKSSSGFVAEATSSRKLYLSAAAGPVAGVAAGGWEPAGLGPAGGAVVTTGASKVTTNCNVAPGAKSRSDSPVIRSQSCLVLSSALT